MHSDFPRLTFKGMIQLVAVLGTWMLGPVWVHATGTATVSPGSVVIGQGVATTTVTYTVPAGGFSAGARIEVQLPANWYSYLQTTDPASQGFVFDNNASLVLTTVSQSTGSMAVLSSSGTIAGNTAVQIIFKNLAVPCPYAGETQAKWTVRAATASVAALTEVASPPVQALNSGPAVFVGFSPWDPLNVIRSQVSPPVTIQAQNNCGRPAAVSANLAVSVSGLDSASGPDGTAVFSLSNSLSPATTWVMLASGTTSSTVYYRTGQTGSLAIRLDYINPQFGYAQQAMRTVNAVASAPGFTALSVDTGSPGSATSLTLTPDGDGNADYGFIHFTPSDAALQWRVRISSDGFNTWTFERWGYGDPGSTVGWDGRFQYSPRTVPNGTYTVRVEYPGLAVNNSLSFTVNTQSITGTVTLGGQPVKDARVNAYAQNGTGYGEARTDDTGAYTLNGLRSGVTYGMYCEFVSTTTQAVLRDNKNNIAAGSTGVNFSFSNPGRLRIAATLSAPAPVASYGSVNVRTSDYSKFFNANIRFQPGSTASDDGAYPTASSWTVLGVPPGTYVVEAVLPGYGTTTQTVSVSAGATTDVSFALNPKATVYGIVDLGSPVAAGTWVSIEGTRQGSSFPSVWGGVFLNVGQSSGVYTVFSVDAGTWRFRARPQIYQPKDITITVAGSNYGDPVNGGADFSGFVTGGQITGTLTVTGNLSGLSNPYVGINAFSNSLGIYQYVSVPISTATSPSTATYVLNGLADGTYQVFAFLDGFEVTPPGPKSATVTSGLARRDLTLARVTGAIAASLVLPGGASDYGQVHLSLRSMNGGSAGQEVDASGATYTFPNLPSGFYTLSATYQTTGVTKRIQLSVVNGQTTSVTLNLTAPAYTVSGTVSVQSGFTMKLSTGPTVTIQSIPALLAAATNQTLILGGQLTYGGAVGSVCSGGTSVTATTARVEAFLKDFNGYSESNRDGFSNCFERGRYRYATLNSFGQYTLSGLSEGVWEISVYPFFDGGTSPNVAIDKQTVTLAADRTGIDFALSGGSALSGTIQMPTGLTDFRTFDVEIRTPRGERVQSSKVTIGASGSPAASAAFSFDRLADGTYSLSLRDEGDAVGGFGQVAKYVAKPQAFTISGADLSNVTIQLAKAARIVGQLSVRGKNPDGSVSSTLVTNSNRNLLPSNFFISAQAFPWVEGGYRSAEQSSDGPDLTDDNQFHIEGLVPGIYDLFFRQQSFGFAAQSQGGVNLAQKTLAQIKVSEGQTLDVGTINLVPGLSLSGIVRDSNQNGLANITVRAWPSNSKNGDSGTETTTDPQGQFTLFGLDESLKNYDVVAAPRPDFQDSTPLVAYGEQRKRAVNITTSTAANLVFTLSAANASLNGRVVTEDGGALSFPEDDRAGYPAAAVYLKRDGSADSDDPLGEIRGATDLNGNFSLPYLVPGNYSMQVLSLGYRTYKAAVAVSGATNAGTITLQTGPRLTATLAKPDGTAVTTNDVQSAVAVTSDLESILFGQIKSDSVTRNIQSLTFDGFELNKTYSILLFDELQNIVQPTEGRSIRFTGEETENRSVSMTYRLSAPTAFVQVRKLGTAGAVTLSFYFSRPLRNTQSFDQDPSNFVTVTAGAGALSGAAVAGDRRSLSVTYTPAAGEETATVRLLAYTTDVDPATGAEFTLTKNAVLRFGQKASAEKNINPALGGTVSLAADDDPSIVNIQGNSLRTSTGAAASADASYSVSFYATEDVAGISGVRQSRSAGARTMSLQSAMALGARAFLPEAYAAMRAADTLARTSAVSPFSAFYSVLLPAGISHTLAQNATLTLYYSDDVEDPSALNVYYFDEDGQRYLIENSNRVVDTVNRTISVQVSHFSTFVILQNSQPVVTVVGGSSAEADMQVFNFPNPFNLERKTKTLARGSAADETLSTDGTIIRYSVPARFAGAVSVTIYDVAGQKVRSIALGNPAADTYHYVAWDGRNDAGNKVASGVYLGVLKVGDHKKVWKMAVIK